MLWSVGINVSPKFEQTGLIPLGRVGHYLIKEILEPFCLVHDVRISNHDLSEQRKYL
jgi:hypothetical protein